MKTKLLLGVLCLVTLTMRAQFITKPLNFPNTLFGIYTYSILDHNHAWFGADRVDWQNLIIYPYPYAVRTNDGGNTWHFDSIPATGSTIAVQEVSAVDSNICYYGITNNDVTFWIYKTTDGGATWANKTTNQFTGGFLNFVHAFSADTVIATGDPTSGFWEIQRSTNGGDTWTRVPSTDIPANVSNEGSNWMYHSIQGNTTWFATNRGRCYKSTDRGLTWTVTTVFSGISDYCDVKFASQMNGVFFRPGIVSVLRKTTDGGSTWSPVDLTGIGVSKVYTASPVGGFSQGFVYSAPGTQANCMNIYFTPDLFSTNITIGTNIATTGYLSFKDATTGWLTGPGVLNNNIYKYDGMLPVKEISNNDHLQAGIYPNPSSAEALFHLSSKAATCQGKLKIYDLTGKLISEKPVEANREWSLLESAPFRNGVYFVEYTNANGAFANQKWVVQH